MHLALSNWRESLHEISQSVGTAPCRSHKYTYLYAYIHTYVCSIHTHISTYISLSLSLSFYTCINIPRAQQLARESA